MKALAQCTQCKSVIIIKYVSILERFISYGLLVKLRDLRLNCCRCVYYLSACFHPICARQRAHKPKSARFAQKSKWTRVLVLSLPKVSWGLIDRYYKNETHFLLLCGLRWYLLHLFLEVTTRSCLQKMFGTINLIGFQPRRKRNNDQKWQVSFDI